MMSSSTRKLYGHNENTAAVFVGRVCVVGIAQQWIYTSQYVLLKCWYVSVMIHPSNLHVSCMTCLGPIPVVLSSTLGSNTARASPPLRSSNSWGEKRASFSDVVARNDGPLYSSIVAPQKCTQQQQSSEVALSPFAGSSTRSSTSSNIGGSTAGKVPEPSVPNNISASLGELHLLTLFNFVVT
jgi:hypothetical protein